MLEMPKKRWRTPNVHSEEAQELARVLSNEIETSIALAAERYERFSDLERQYLNEDDPTFEGPYGDSAQYQVPALRWVIDSTASTMSDAMMGADPVWVVSYSLLPPDIRADIENDISMIANAKGFSQEVDLAITYALLLGTSMIEVDEESEFIVEDDDFESELSMNELQYIVDTRAERMMSGGIRVWRAAGPTVKMHHPQRCFVVPFHEQYVEKARAVGVYTQLRKSQADEKGWPGWDPASGGEVGKQSASSSADGPDSNPLLTNAGVGLGSTQDLDGDEESHEFFIGIVRAKLPHAYSGWCDYKFVLHRKSKTLCMLEHYKPMHGRRPYLLIRPIPRDRSWMGTGLGELLSPLSKACTMLLTMYMDSIRAGIAPPIRVDQMSLDMLRGQEIGPGKIFPADDATAVIQGVNTFDIQNAIRMLKEFMDLVVGAGNPSMGVRGPGETATGAAIVDRRSSLRGNKILHRIQEGLAAVPEIFRYSIYGSYDAISRVYPLRTDNPLYFIEPMVIAGNGQSIYSSSEYRQQIVMAFFDRMIQFPLVQQNPVAAMHLLKDIASVMEIPSNTGLFEEIEKAAQQQMAGMGGGMMPMEEGGIPASGSPPSGAEGGAMAPPMGG